MSTQWRLWSSHKLKDSLTSPLMTPAALLSFLAYPSGPSDTMLLLIALFGGPKAVFAFSTAAGTWCSGPEVIMWVTSQLRLEGTQEWKQTGQNVNSLVVAGLMTKQHFVQNNWGDWPTWWRGGIILPRCDKLEVRPQGSDGAPGTDAAVAWEASSE